MGGRNSCPLSLGASDSGIVITCFKYKKLRRELKAQKEQQARDHELIKDLYDQMQDIGSSSRPYDAFEIEDVDPAKP